MTVDEHLRMMRAYREAKERYSPSSRELSQREAMVLASEGSCGWLVQATPAAPGLEQRQVVTFDTIAPAYEAFPLATTYLLAQLSALSAGLPAGALLPKLPAT